MTAAFTVDALTLALLGLAERANAATALAERGGRSHCSDPRHLRTWISDRSRDAPESAQAA
jgi:hypothetical protein